MALLPTKTTWHNSILPKEENVFGKTKTPSPSIKRHFFRMSLLSVCEDNNLHASILVKVLFVSITLLFNIISGNSVFNEL